MSGCHQTLYYPSEVDLAETSSKISFEEKLAKCIETAGKREDVTAMRALRRRVALLSAVAKFHWRLRSAVDRNELSGMNCSNIGSAVAPKLLAKGRYVALVARFRKNITVRIRVGEALRGDSRQPWQGGHPRSLLAV